MRKITANLIFPVSGPPIPYGYLVVDNENRIVDVVDTGGTLKEIAGLEYYSGILVPGFVNAHCHLELSHLKGMIDPGTGMHSFLHKVRILREMPDDLRQKAMKQALKIMWAEGIQAIGDVCNTSDSIELKMKTPMACHSFIELFDRDELSAGENVNLHIQIAKQFHEKGLHVSLAPHAPYSVSNELIALFSKMKEFNQITTLHFKEHSAEESSNPRRIPEQLSQFRNILLVHNLYAGAGDIEQILQLRQNSEQKTFWVMCPNSNQFIQNKLPDIEIFRKNQATICLGTDSLASNRMLSILDEMKTISRGFPKIPFTELLQWATLNGARALRLDEKVGSFERMKSPGVLLISDYDFKQHRLTDHSQVQRLV